MSNSTSLLGDFPIVIELPVQWGEQDAFGHVNNVVHFRWFESARIAYLEQTGAAGLAKQQGLGPILVRIACNYRRQLHYPDTVQIGARITALGKSSFTMEHAALSQSQDALVADGDSVIAIFDYQANATRPIPESLRELIEAVEGRSFTQ